MLTEQSETVENKGKIITQTYTQIDGELQVIIIYYQ